MELVNTANLPALLHRFVVDEEMMGASLAARVSYTMQGGVLKLAAEQTWPVSPGPWACAYGPMDPDEIFYRGGADIFIFGHARAAGKKPIESMDVVVRVGDRFEHRVRVFGDRTWIARDGKLAISEPVRFIEMPLTLDRAYGGKDVWDQLEQPFVPNPAGRGYAMDEGSARGKALPNIENPSALITKWDDRPDPVGTGAPGMMFGPRVVQNVVFDEKTHAIMELKPRLFNAAFPGMIVPRLMPGERLTIEGVRHEGDVSFKLPEAPVFVRFTKGEKVHEMTPLIDQVGIEPDKGVVFITWRQPFRYSFIPEQRRAIELLPIAAVGGA